MPNAIKGRIFNIQRFSIHDGPGIRTIVFFKGCFMRCAWCCNPESQAWDFETMVTGGIPKTVGRDVTVGEVLEEVRRDRMYYRRSGAGGLTLSGGECLAQPDFAVSLAKALEEGAKSAYGAVMKPTEGTILTVARESVEYAVSRINEESTVESLFKDLVTEMDASLKRTPEILTVLAGSKARAEKIVT